MRNIALTLPSKAYTRALPLLTVVLAAAAAVWPTWPPLLETWHVMPDYSYGELLAPFVVCWIAARSVDLPAPTIRVSPVAVVALLACLTAWLIAYGASSAIGEQLMIPVILWSAVWAAFGLRIALRVAVPIACLYFAIPLWEFLVPALQSASVWVAETVLGAIGVPVHIDGALVSIPEGTFRIAEACAGRGYFVVCISIAALLAGTTGMRPLRAAIFLLISAALAIVMNWIRVLTVIYAGHVTNMTSYLVAHEHITFGWALFAVLMVIVGLIGRRFAQSLPQRPPSDALEPARSVGLRELVVRPALPATLVLLLIPVIAVAYSRRESASPLSPSIDIAHWTLPAGRRGWTGPLPAGAAWRPQFRGTAAVRRAAYRSPLGEVQVFAAEYVREGRGGKLVSSENVLFADDWMLLRRGVLPIIRDAPGAQPRLIHVETPAGGHWLVSYLYRVGSVVTGNSITAQLAYGVLAWGGPLPTRIVAVAARCLSTCERARRQLESFWGAQGGGLLSTQVTPALRTANDH